MIIQQYSDNDLKSIIDIFFTAIFAIDTSYSVEQLKAWGNGI